MKFIHNYNDLTAFTEDYNGSGYTEPWVSLTHENNKVDFNKKELWFRVFENGYGDEYTAEELETISHIWDYWYVEDPESIAYDEAPIEFRQPVRIYFVEHLDPEFDKDDPETYRAAFIPVDGVYYSGSGHNGFAVNDGHCLTGNFGAFNDGYQTPGKGTYGNRCAD